MMNIFGILSFPKVYFREKLGEPALIFQPRLNEQIGYGPDGVTYSKNSLIYCALHGDQDQGCALLSNVGDMT